MTIVKKKTKRVFICLIAIILVIGVIVFTIWFMKKQDLEKAQNCLIEYMNLLNAKEYDKLYEKISAESKTKISYEDFVARNENIYEGIGLLQVATSIQETEKIETNYHILFDQVLETSNGNIEFHNDVYLVKQDKEYKLVWDSHIIYPNLKDTDKVRVSSLSATRGNIYDRNGNLLAGKGKVYSAGFVPGKMNEDAEQDIIKVAELLDMSKENIENLLSASYVKEDTFVELKKFSLEEESLVDQLLEVKGIKIIEKEARVYPYKEATSHLLGYVQGISKEELENHAGEGYNKTSVIGKTGIERSYESTLRGIDGFEIYILDEEGNKKEILLKQDLKNGEDITLTIDANLQKSIYDRFCSQRGFFLVMNPTSGEMLAMISTPAYDSNDFVNGISSSEWNRLNEDPAKPLYNRYLASWCPGSTFKVVTALIGLDTGKIDPNEDYGHSGYRYQKDSSWGDYWVTTLQEYFSPAILQNALKYSDNIYFAKAGMNIGAETLTGKLKEIGFGESMPFEQSLTASSFSADNQTIEGEIKLADSAYGQGDILVNPLHMASIYSSLVNEGNMVLPYVLYEEGKEPSYFKENVFRKETVQMIKEDLIQVVEGYDATAHGLKTEGITIGAKTGTAELKSAKDTQAEELSWLNAFTADGNVDKNYLVISMREDDKQEYFSLFPIVKSIFE